MSASEIVGAYVRDRGKFHPLWVVVVVVVVDVGVTREGRFTANAGCVITRIKSESSQ